VLSLHSVINELSILIPVFNDYAVPLVEALRRQAEGVEGLKYEVVAVDDGSTNMDVVSKNEAMNAMPRCRYVKGGRHDCRSAMRNNLARHGRYEWHLMVDARLSVVRSDFIRSYLDSGAQVGQVACGGVKVDGGDDAERLYRENLRFRYEKHEERNHSMSVRRRHPYKSFRTTNFFYHRTVLERTPYDERVKGYGYEDVMLGVALEKAGVKVNNIDNPVAYTSFEDNSVYIRKIEEAMLTLKTFAAELKDFSPLLVYARRLNRLHLLPLVRLWHKVFGATERRNLCGDRPRLLLFKLYKLGFLLNV